jgi:hypothetical protein
MRWVLAPSPGRFSLKCTDPMSSMLIGGDLANEFVDIGLRISEVSPLVVHSGKSNSEQLILCP